MSIFYNPIIQLNQLSHNIKYFLSYLYIHDLHLFANYIILLILKDTSTRNPQMSDDQHFEKIEIGSHETPSIEAGSLKKGRYCMLNGFPCKVTQYSTAESKSNIVGIDIFTGKHYQETVPSSQKMQLLNVGETQLEVTDIDSDDMVTFVVNNGELKNDLKLPVQDQNTYHELKKIWDQNNGKNQVFFTIITFNGKEKIASGKVKEE